MPPFTRKQVRLAQAVEHGFRPTGKAKNFTKKLASDIVVETNDGKDRSMIRKKKASK